VNITNGTKNLPWKDLYNTLANRGFRMIGWPSLLQLPHDLAEGGGIRNMPVWCAEELVKSLNDEENGIWFLPENHGEESLVRVQRSRWCYALRLKSHFILFYYVD
jgi:hypothetical protein